MTANYPALIVIIPLAVAVITPVLGRISIVLAQLSAAAALLVAFISSLGALQHALAEGSWHYYFGGWAPPWGIEYVIDPLSGGLATLVSFIGLLVLIYAVPHLATKPARENTYFYTLYLLCVAGLLGMVVTGDVFNLYVFLEISSLAAYALIAFGGSRATVAGYRYLLIGTAAACLYLLGIGYLYALTGSLNMADLAELLPAVDAPTALVIATVLIVIGLGIKMALFPLHGWLPDAYSSAPAPVTGFIAAVMAKVSAYAIYRICFFVLKDTGTAIIALNMVGWMAAAGIIFGSIMAIAQNDLWRMLAYSSVAQMCYIALGVALGNTYGIYGALLHILNHAVTKGCLFLIAGSIAWKTGIRDITQFAKMCRKMPWTMAVFVVAALSMIGLPPTAGFFSKMYLVMGSVEAGAWGYVAVLVASSLLTAIYFFRVIEYAYLHQPAQGEAVKLEQENSVMARRWELPASMLMPIILLGIGVLTLGVLSEKIIADVIQFALPWGMP
ncbi:MAG: monovalent cation/H+ antiporter subunit D family protein [Clostridia bacterium]|nr:monovalent cation/H+ antiporter subunit D family protein [Clostridia bacterium]